MAQTEEFSRLPAAGLAARSRDIRFTAVAAAAGRKLMTATAWVLIVAGMIPGALWRGTAFCGVCIAYGFREGAGRPQPEPQAAKPAVPAPPG